LGIENQKENQNGIIRGFCENITKAHNSDRKKLPTGEIKRRKKAKQSLKKLLLQHQNLFMQGGNTHLNSLLFNSSNIGSLVQFLQKNRGMLSRYEQHAASVNNMANGKKGFNGGKGDVVGSETSRINDLDLLREFLNKQSLGGPGCWGFETFGATLGLVENDLDFTGGFSSVGNCSFWTGGAWMDFSALGALSLSGSPLVCSSFWSRSLVVSFRGNNSLEQCMDHCDRP